MKTQTEAFFDWIQEQLKNPNFQGMAFQNGGVLSPEVLRRCESPEELMNLCQEAARVAQEECERN